MLTGSHNAISVLLTVRPKMDATNACGVNRKEVAKNEIKYN